MINEPEAKKTYANVFLVFGLLSSVILLGMFLFTPEILRLLTTANYHGAAWVASILSLNVVLIAFTYIASIGTNIVKNNKYYSVGIVIAAVITVVLDIILIPVWGKEGSAIATVLAQAVVPIYLFYHAQKLYPIDYEFGKVIFFILLSIVLGTIGRFIEYKSLSMAIFSKAFIALFFLCCAFFIIRGNLKMVLIKLRGRNSQFT
jgi:O-antigen/teichoic acid export membrane protein